MSATQEKAFDPKRYLEWFDATVKLIEETPKNNLGWMDAGLNILGLKVKMKVMGGTFPEKSALARNFNRDGSLKR